MRSFMIGMGISCALVPTFLFAGFSIWTSLLFAWLASGLVIFGVAAVAALVNPRKIIDGIAADMTAQTKTAPVRAESKVPFQ